MTPLRLALWLLGVCGVAGWQLSFIGQPLMQMSVGPVLAPTAIVAGLSLLALLYGWSAWHGRQVDLSQEAGQEALPGSTIRLLSLLGGGVAFIVLVIPLGFVMPATLCGMCIARAFDAPFNGKSLLICGLIAGVFWFVFARLLGVGLGPALPWLF